MEGETDSESSENIINTGAKHKKKSFRKKSEAALKFKNRPHNFEPIKMQTLM